MKKKTTFVLLLLSILLFVFLYTYTETRLLNQYRYFNYHVSNLLEYILLWSLSLLILSLGASKLDINKYKIWLLVSISISVFSLVIAYMTGDGNGGIVDIDGELVTWFLVGLYSFLSFIYFIIQLFKNRKSNKSIQ